MSHDHHDGELHDHDRGLSEDVSKQVYASDGYEQSVRNLSRTSLASDNVFSDGWSLQLATLTGTVDGGLTATLTVPV